MRELVAAAAWREVRYLRNSLLLPKLHHLGADVGNALSDGYGGGHGEGEVGPRKNGAAATEAAPETRALYSNFFQDFFRGDSQKKTDKFTKFTTKHRWRPCIFT